MPRLEIHDAVRRRRFEILDDAFTAGSAEGDVLRLVGDGIDPEHLAFDHDARGRVRVSARPGALLNGEEIVKASLRHGDRIELGPFLVVFCMEGEESPQVAPEEIPAVRAARAAARARGEGLVLDIAAPSAVPRSVPPLPRGRGGAGGAVARRRGEAPRSARRDEAPESSGAARRAPRRRGMPTSMIVWNAMLVTGIVGWLIYRSFAAAPLVRDPEDVIELAEAQWNSGHADEAYATLRAARDRADDQVARRKIDEAVRRLEQRARRLEDLARIRAARDALDELVGFANDWFRPATDKRPAAREVERRLRDWDERFAAVCKDYDEGRRVLDASAELHAQVAPFHHLDEPDTADDVLFRSDRLTKLRLRRYRQAFEILEAWLAARGDAPGVDRVRQELATLREQGPAWVEDQRAAIERMVQRDEIGRAVTTLRFLVDEALPPEWLDTLPARLDQLQSRLGAGR